MNPEQQRARRTVAEELRASLRQHEADTEARVKKTAAEMDARIEAATQAGEARIAEAVQKIEARAAIFERGFWGRLNWLLTSR